jgi:DNA invertase Pin-like site-specific DNA recombinase
MQKRIFIYSRLPLQQIGTKAEVLHDLQRAAEDRGDTVTGTFVDDDRIVGRGKYAGWNALVRKLDEADQVIVGGAGDLPGRNVADLLKLLGLFRDHSVTLYFYREGIDTGSTGFALLKIVEAYHRAKLSAAIKAGQAASGKRIGRPPIPPGVLSRIRASLKEGLGIRPTARKLNVSAASVTTVARSMRAAAGAEEAT